MLRVYVDSGSSIKMFEKEKYGVEIIPLKILLGDKEYNDGDWSMSASLYYPQIINIDNEDVETSLLGFDDLNLDEYGQYLKESVEKYSEKLNNCLNENNDLKTKGTTIIRLS